MNRRDVLRTGTLAIAAAGTVVGPARAAWQPSRPVEIVAHNGPGSGPDVFARAIVSTIEQEKLSPVRFQVTNRVGGGGATAMNYVVDKRGDPGVVSVWTSLWISLPLVQAEARATVRDMTAIARLVIEPALIVVRADSPFKTMADLIEAARQKPGQIRQSGGSVTARDNIVRQLLMTSTGTRWSFISFPAGSERIAALLGGHVELMIAEPTEAGEQVRAGRLRVLAQVTERRLAGFPDVPTLKEAGFGIPDVSQARGFVAPPGIPAEAIAYYEDLFARVAKSATWQKYIQDNQFEEAFLGAQATAGFFADYEPRLRTILQEAGVKVAR
ncbi:MAG: tripartite tricarboxylate transporter substrate binding protein [Alphaproteobacteria bacterium]|nr:tripartite tricarboxylate transporter substrate binding protein [Alphaproteobacteria bacterium]